MIHSEREVCGNCKFVADVQAGRGDLAPLGNIFAGVIVCRRGPPSLHVMTDDVTEVITSIFPPVHEKGWCGAWQLDPQVGLAR